MTVFLLASTVALADSEWQASRAEHEQMIRWVVGLLLGVFAGGLLMYLAFLGLILSSFV